MRKPTDAEIAPLVAVLTEFMSELTKSYVNGVLTKEQIDSERLYVMHLLFGAVMTGYVNGLLDGTKKVGLDDFDISVRALCESIHRRLEGKESGVQEKTDPFKNRLN